MRALYFISKGSLVRPCFEWNREGANAIYSIRPREIAALAGPVPSLPLQHRNGLAHWQSEDFPISNCRISRRFFIDRGKNPATHLNDGAGEQAY